MKKQNEIKEELNYLLLQEQMAFLSVPQGYKAASICSIGEVAYHFNHKRELEDKIKRLEK